MAYSIHHFPPTAVIRLHGNRNRSSVRTTKLREEEGESDYQ